MTIDAYSPCPGGTGKKLKFCCSDLVSELDKIQRMVEGDQPQACLEHIARLESKYPDRACLLSYKFWLSVSHGDAESIGAVADSFLAHYPENSIALAAGAIAAAVRGKPRDGIAPYERALLACGESAPSMVVQVGLSLGAMLLNFGDVLPAQFLLMRLSRFAGETRTRAVGLLSELQRNQRVPMLLKPLWKVASAPDGAPWKYEFDVAVKTAAEGRNVAAAEKFAALAPLAGNSRELWNNLAILRSSLGDYPGAIAALQRLSALAIPLDDAVEAEALAQELIVAQGETVDEVTLTFAVTDIDQLHERLSADSCCEFEAADPRDWPAEEGPPPRARGIVLDRPPPPSETEVSLSVVPRVIGAIYLFGKQTDRPARLEVTAIRPRLDEVRGLLLRAGSAIGELLSEDVTDSGQADTVLFGDEPRWPNDIPLERYRSLSMEHRRDLLFSQWPDTALTALGGGTFRQAAADPAGRITALACVLRLELDRPFRVPSEWFNELRRAFQLPEPESVDPTGLDGERIKTPRLGRVMVEKATDEQLLELTARALILVGDKQVVARLAREVVARPTIEQDSLKLVCYQTLLDPEADSDLDTSLRYVEEARQIALKLRQSSAHWDLEELIVRVRRREMPEVVRLIEHINDQHLREPGIADALLNIMVQAGLVDPRGMSAGPPPEASPIVLPAGPEPGKLWTPDSDRPAGAKQAIWTPDG